MKYSDKHKLIFNRRYFIKNIKLIIFLSSLITLISCDWFERQKHDVVRPQPPTYRIYGHIGNIATGEMVEGLELLLIQTSSFEGGWIDQTIVYTDENGYFEFENVPRGVFSLHIYKNGELLFQKTINLIEGKDLEFNIYEYF